MLTHASGAQAVATSDISCGLSVHRGLPSLSLYASSATFRLQAYT